EERAVTNEIPRMGGGLLYDYTRPKVGQKKIAVLDGLLQHNNLILNILAQIKLGILFFTVA
ncbi:MAG: hypothetical protein D3923_16210, partial [Candidatus Electrothrix sp. AR3]|nr:hypothetical protein [Candidatus Electrothrix sp. AR3]